MRSASFFVLSTRSRVWPAALFVAVTSMGFAQAQTVPGQAKKAEPPPRASDEAVARIGMGQAKDLAQMGQIAAAEQALTPSNRAKSGTAAWHIETAQRLMQTAEQLARESKPGSIAALAGVALQHLVHAERLARDPRTKASAKKLAGSIQERYLGDQIAALANYRAAAQLAPTTVRANQAAERLQKTEENLRAKSLEGGR